jgi:RNA polymerase sigma-70 factor (ECF subfamily)
MISSPGTRDAADGADALQQHWTPERWPRDAAEFEQFVEAYQGHLVRYALRRLRNNADAEDVVQDVFLRAYMMGHCRRIVFRPVPWLYKVTANACTDLLRGRQRRLGREWAARLESLDVLSARDGTSKPVDDEDAALRAEMLLQRISRVQAETIRLRVFGELNIREIAAVMHCSTGTVNSRLRYGFGKLRRVVGKDR